MVELSSEKIIDVVTWTALGAGLLVFFLAWVLVQYFRAMIKKQQELVNTMIETQEKERLRIAREMHDNFGNIFSIIHLEITTLEKINDINRMQTSFNYLSENIDIARKELRYNVNQLAPGNLKTIDWLEEMKKFKELLNTPSFYFDVDVAGDILKYTELNQTNLFRICQELINNLIKYAQATQAAFVITFTQSHLELQYSDNGIGFSFDEKKQKGFGLRSLQARTEAMHGKCKCNSIQGEGTRWNFSFQHKYLLEKRTN
jgi:signal transduction histidine kinase